MLMAIWMSTKTKVYRFRQYDFSLVSLPAEAIARRRAIPPARFCQLCHSPASPDSHCQEHHHESV
jgi:hypothetical protein